jgi:hypothetical protein
MSYYQGDYYRGGFFSFLGGLAKKAVGFIPGVGPIASTAIGAIGRAAPALGSLGGKVLKGVAKHPVLSAAAAVGSVAGGASMAHMGRGGMVAAAGGVPGRGMHISKKTGALVRNRHMRVTNPRALRRAIRRAHGFAKLAMKTIHLVHPKKKGKFGGWKKRKK